MQHHLVAPRQQGQGKDKACFSFFSDSLIAFLFFDYSHEPAFSFWDILSFSECEFLVNEDKSAVVMCSKLDDFSLTRMSRTSAKCFTFYTQRWTHTYRNRILWFLKIKQMLNVPIFTLQGTTREKACVMSPLGSIKRTADMWTHYSRSCLNLRNNWQGAIYNPVFRIIWLLFSYKSTVNSLFITNPTTKNKKASYWLAGEH